MQRLTIYLLTIILFTNCSGEKKTGQNTSGSNKYAHGFQVEKTEYFTKLSVFDPWEKAENISVNYYLVKKGASLPDSLTNKKVIRTPVERVICLSTTHIAFLEALNETGAIAGVSGSQYVSNQTVRERIKDGGVPDVGYSQNLNYEEIVNQQPDLVM
ncbi:MAG: hypothetical protein ACOCWK_09615, partial [Tangfeifania sp.]